MQRCTRCPPRLCSLASRWRSGSNIQASDSCQNCISSLQSLIAGVSQCLQMVFSMSLLCSHGAVHTPHPYPTPRTHARTHADSYRKKDRSAVYKVGSAALCGDTGRHAAADAGAASRAHGAALPDWRRHEGSGGRLRHRPLCHLRQGELSALVGITCSMSRCLRGTSTCATRFRSNVLAHVTFSTFRWPMCLMSHPWPASLGSGSCLHLSGG